MEANAISAGQGAGMINDIPSWREPIERMVGGAKSIPEGLNEIASRPTA